MKLLFKRIVLVFVMLLAVCATFAADNSSENFGKICILANKDYKIYSIQVAHSRGAASNFDEELTNGLKAIKCAGHTPGHTVYNIGNIYFIGDLMHAAELQYPHPSFSHIKYDMNREEAAKSRKLAKETFHGEWFGAHVPFPGTITNP